MKTILLAGVVMFGLLRSASAFSLAGPVGNGGDAWQSAVIGYGPPTDFVAPKNYGEGYRRNTPELYYAFDANFLDYFGSNGMAAVEGACAIMNKAFTNNPTGMTNGLDGYSNLSGFPFETRHVNYQAQALGLFDLKSFTLGTLVRQMGLADPVEYTWTLHDRYDVPAIPCPAGMEYLVVQRNFDTGGSPIAGSQTVSSFYSPYVNNTLYSYEIEEACTGPNPLAISAPFPVDPLADTYSAVASQIINMNWGDYYTGLTHDDVMGLQYLLTSNNIVQETAAAGSLLTTATTNGVQLFPVSLTTNGTLVGGVYYGTYDLGALLSSSLTNPPATLEALFPGVIVASSTNYFTYVTNYNVTDYFTNYIGSAAGSPPVLVIATNASVGIGEFYVDTFANIVTNHYYSNTVETLQTVTVGPRTGAPPGSPAVTNTASTTIILTNVPSGDYYILPTNTCGLDIITPDWFTNVVTNITASAFGTNAATATNTTGTVSSSSQTVIYTTNYIFIIATVSCAQTTDATGLYEGVEKINFVQSSYDSLIGQFYQPITNNYTMVVVTNSQARLQTFQRIVTTPDFLFSADDQVSGPGAIPLVSVFSESYDFDTANVLPDLAGPGTVIGPTKIAFEKAGPVYFNDIDNLTGDYYWLANPGADQLAPNEFYLAYFMWGSFDGTTNAPVAYPNGVSTDSLGNLILVQISPASLPNGTEGVAYPSTTFTSTGGAFTPSYTWSAAGLPNGLSVSVGGTLSGTPTQSGTFIFTLTMTDSLSRSVQWNYPLIIQ